MELFPPVAALSNDPPAEVRRIAGRRPARPRRADEFAPPDESRGAGPSRNDDAIPLAVGHLHCYIFFFDFEAHLTGN
jgi:hypothetical protein